MNPKSWVGNICAGDVDLKTEYLSGRKAANDLLVSHFSTSQAAVNFDALFAHPKVDHLHPNKLYIGSSIGNNEEEDGDLDWDGAMSGGLFQEIVNSDLEANESFEDTQDSVDITEFNGLDIEPTELNPSSKKNNAHYLKVGNEMQYIPTLVKHLLGEDRERKALVTTRSLRAQGVTIEQALWKSSLNSSASDLDISDNIVKAGDLGAILTHVGDQICLAVVEVLNFRQGISKQNLASVDFDDLQKDGAKATTIAVQILQLVAQEPQPDNKTDTLTWWWPESYVQIRESTGGPILQHHFATWVIGKQFNLLSPNIIYNSVELPVQSIDNSDLEHALDDAWNDLVPESEDLLQNINSLPEIFGPGLNQLPYKLLEDGTPTLYVPYTSIPAQVNLVKLAGNDKRDCLICGEEFHISEMRNHVGIHILKF